MINPLFRATDRREASPMKQPKLISGALLLFLGSAAFLQAQLEDKGRYLKAALRTEKWIAGAAISGSEGLAWPADPQDPKSVNSTLYAGNPGVVLFYLELYASTGDKGHLKKACAGADFLIARLAEEKTMGLYEGL